MQDGEPQQARDQILRTADGYRDEGGYGAPSWGVYAECSRDGINRAAVLIIITDLHSDTGQATHLSGPPLPPV